MNRKLPIVDAPVPDSAQFEDGPSLIELIPLALLQQLQDSFAEATGVASMITTPTGRPITRPSRFSRLCKMVRASEVGARNCARSDSFIGRPNPAGPLLSPCLSCGLWDGGASIFAGSQHVGNWLVGQVRNEDVDESHVIGYAREVGADEATFRQAFGEVTQMSTERFQAVCEFLFLMANQLSSMAYQRLEQLRQEKERVALEQQLQESRRLQAIGKLAGGVAHDFNNLLTTIMGQVQLLQLDVGDGLLSQEQLLSQLGEIERAGQRATELTRQLLAFSRQQLSSPAPIDLNALIAKFDTSLGDLVPGNIRVQTVLEPGEITVVADRNQLEQVLINLITNARDAMPSGGLLCLETSTVLLDEEYALLHPGARPGTFAQLTVRDTGVGMSSEVRERIFEPFFTTKPTGNGPGLGLATVHGIVLQAGGYVSVESEEGKGSAFHVFWPLTIGRPDALEEASGSHAQGGSETILLCEDSLQVRQLTTQLLERAGYRVIAAGSGHEALQLFEQMPSPPALLFTDVIMPGLNGRELADRINVLCPGIRVLFMSGYTAEIIGQCSVLEPGIRLLEKPFTTTDLLSAVRKALDNV